jgi:hypothetical protein
MAYTYLGTSGFVRTGEAITVFPSGLIQKKVTVVRRSAKDESLVLGQAEADGQLGGEFSAYPLPSANKQNNGFTQFDIVGYQRGPGGINYKYRKLSSFIRQDQFRPRTVNVSVEVGIRSTVALSGGTQVETANENGDLVVSTVYEIPNSYDGKLIAYTENGRSEFIDGVTTESIRESDVIITEKVTYRPTVVVESVSSTYYGKFTEYITTSSVKFFRVVIESKTEPIVL